MSTKLKNGIKTTELWLSIVIIVLTQLNVLQVGSDKMKGYITAALGIAYTLSRGLAKLNGPKDEVVDPAIDGGFRTSGPDAEVPGGAFPSA